MVIDTNISGKVIAKSAYSESESQPRLLPVNEVARFLGVRPSTVRRWGESGLLRSYEIGVRHNLMFKQEDVFNFFILNFFDKYQEESA
jgi:excisionase family DNA binding protein